MIGRKLRFLFASIGCVWQYEARWKCWSVEFVMGMARSVSIRRRWLGSSSIQGAARRPAVEVSSASRVQGCAGRAGLARAVFGASRAVSLPGWMPRVNASQQMTRCIDRRESNKEVKPGLPYFVR